VTRRLTIVVASIVLIFASAGPPQWADPLVAAPNVAAAQRAASAPSQALTAALPNDDDSVKFAVLGDTGTGGSAQYDIGKLLAAARGRFPYEFVIMLGDNMYGGESPADFVKKFERPYKPLLDAGVKFYATLGNHDEPSQRFYEPFNMDGKRFYKFRKGDAEFFVLDSTYMTPEQVEWVREALKESDAKWKIPYFHHPIYSSGEKHGSETDLRVLIEPLFLENGVDVVFAGHEHFYERLKPQWGIYYYTAGGSAKLRKGNLSDRSTLTEKGFDTDNSFMLVEIDQDRMFFETISRRAQVVDSGSLPRRELTETSSNSPSTPQPAGAATGRTN
jgi:predicted phosphodiesterase